MPSISLVVAFLGGALTLLPACGPALLPAFFAVTFMQGKKLVVAVLLFALGFGIIFVPFMLGVSFLVRVLDINREFIFHFVGGLLVLFGFASLFGVSSPRITKHATNRKNNIWTPFIIGLTFGFTAGSCSGPIFGAIGTLALVGGNTVHVFFLALSFLLGMFAPLLLLAGLIQRYGVSLVSKLTRLGISVTIFKKEHRFFLSNILAGAIFITFGLFYILTSSNGYWSLLGEGSVLDWFFNANNALLR